METSKQAAVDFAKVQHSDAVVAGGVESYSAMCARDVIAILQEAPSEPLNAIVFGALYDFMAHLTALEKAFTVGGKYDAKKMLDHFTQWLKERELSAPLNPLVGSWQEHLGGKAHSRKLLAPGMLEGILIHRGNQPEDVDMGDENGPAFYGGTESDRGAEEAE